MIIASLACTLRTPRSAAAILAAVVIAAVALPIAAQTTRAPDFDHLPTGYPLTGAHKATKCELCHVKAIFKGTSKICEGCHAPNTNISAIVTPTTHPPTTQRCDLCHTTVTFTGAHWNHFDAQPGACASCHNGQLAPGKPAGHVPTTQSCDVCHRTTAWRPAGFDHTGIATGCARCHNGATALGKPSAHIATSMPCETCHLSTTSFATWSMNHAQIVNGCASCHGGQFPGVLAKPATHVPTTAPCESCHSSFTSFKGALFSHAGIASQCATCHNGSTALGMPGNHVPTSQPCEACHSASNFTSFAGTQMNHAGISAGCSTCHAAGSNFFGVAVKTPPGNHIPTTQPCEVCHSASNFASFAGAQMNHAGITSGCATCHAAGSSFFGVAVKTPPANHIPTSGAACEGCHSPSAFASFGGTPMNHAPVAAISCATCHETGRSWFGVTIVTRPTLAQDPNHPQTGDCGQCHNTSTFTGVGKPSNHIPTTQPCTLCHSNSNDYSQATMNHAGIASGCATCHGAGLSFANIVPKAPPPTHVPTNQPCEVCHSASNFNSFAGTQMNHAGITSGCTTCHAAGSSFFGVAIKTPPATHIPTGGAACEACHAASNFNTFAGTSMNHGPVSAMPCTNCHETGKSFFGVTIVTRPTPAQDPNHPQTGDCGQCHTTSTFNGVGKPANHIPTNQPCALCHSNPNDYSQATMNHTGITNGCATCHGAGLSFANIVPKAPPPTHIPTSQPCEVCHSASNFSSFAGTQMNHAGITNNCANCHAAGKSFFGVAIKAPPATHIPSSQPCEVCHSASNFNSFAGTQMSHAGITSGCASCHAAGSSFFGVAIKTPPANHIPTGGAACEACHSASTFTSFAGTPMNHAPVSAMTCMTCHETGKSWFGVTIVTRPTPAQDPSHPQSGDCGQCHTTSTFNGNSKPANHIPTNQPCALCHSNPNDYSQATMNHAGITSGCATCHGPGLSFANIVPKAPPATHIPTSQPCEVCHSASNFNSFAGTQMNHAGVTNNCANCHGAGKSFFGVTIKTPPATHIPFGSAACEACHSPNTFTSFAGTPMSHAAVSAMTCVTCHETGKSWFGVNIVTRPTPAQDPSHPQTGDCGQCHTTSTFNGNSKPANHIPTNQPCALCHNNPNDYSQAAMNHTGITSGCATCHGPGLSFANIVPKEPPGTHIPYGGAACEACHSPAKFASFGGTAMNHGAVAGMKCVSCHELGMSWYGVNIVTRPSANHHPGQDCGQCHNTSSFDDAAARLRRAGAAATLPGTGTGGPRFGQPGRPGANAHLGIAVGSCASCHNGTTAAAKSARHVATMLSCDACHRTTTWRPASFTHVGIAPGGCLACHNGSVAKAKAASHFATARSCDACHSASSWIGARYQHLSPAYRGHSASATCKACHKSNAEAVVWLAPAFKPDCAGCHANRFRPETHPKPAGGLHTVVELRDCAGSCHVGGAPGKGSARLLTARHRPTDGSF